MGGGRWTTTTTTITMTTTTTTTTATTTTRTITRATGTTTPATAVATTATMMPTTTATTVKQLPLWTRREAARNRRLVLLGTHVHQHHLLFRDLAVLDVDRLRGIVEARRLQDNQHRTKHAGHREYPEEDPVEHHRHVFPVLLHLKSEIWNIVILVTSNRPNKSPPNFYFFS